MSDKNGAASYSQLMGEEPAHITLKLCTSEPIEVGDFVAAFASLSSQYDRFIRASYPDLAPEAEMFVSEVRKGSVIAELIPFWPSLIATMDQALILEHFIRLYGSRLTTYLHGKTEADISKSELKDFMGEVSAIARDPDASAELEAVQYEDGKKQITASIKFRTPEAKLALKTIEAQKREIEKSTHADHSKVLMVFEQSNVKDTAIGKRTGEWVKIEDVLDRPLPLIYVSEMAEERIKHEIREADDNVYKKGFVVDVNLETKGGKPVAYRVTDIHQVIDLPDD
ncbi:hypothetical protein [Methyloligella solikamskensis]|uniref:Uncharacterized protein n=1 Tax=Methyloligella solikamskensis TaxID=1177756 RepID=A0ABW3JFL5_9HYPH